MAAQPRVFRENLQISGLILRDPPIAATSAVCWDSKKRRTRARGLFAAGFSEKIERFCGFGPMQDKKKVLPFRASKRRRRTKSKAASRIVHGNYVAEFFVSKDAPRVYHHIICKKGSPEILSLGQCRSAAEAERDARETLRSLNEMQTEGNLLSLPRRLKPTG
jgi:hypothetical protein